jgi:hypothetical protein
MYCLIASNGSFLTRILELALPEGIDDGLLVLSVLRSEISVEAYLHLTRTSMQLQFTNANFWSFNTISSARRFVTNKLKLCYSQLISHRL